MTAEIIDQRRRNLVASAALLGSAGAIVAAWPFIASMNPSARAQAAGAPVSVDFAELEPGQQITVEWRGKPVWVLRRTQRMLEDLRNFELVRQLRDPESQITSQQPSYARNTWRSVKPEFLVVIGICTHLGCTPNFRPEIAPDDLGPNWLGGYFCPCHGSRFDLAGRVFKGVPAPTNLVIPPYRYTGKTTVLVGQDQV